MDVFEIVVALLLIGALLAALAQRLRVPYPAFLALAGAGLAVIPGAPAFTMPPELALTLFVAPTLLDAAYDASPRDLRDHWRPIAASAVLMVIVTVAGVAALARWLRPDIGWAAAVALGAIVAPPDAAAASAVLRALHPPHRILVILEGESLFNDATALMIYRVAVASAIGTAQRATDIPLLLVAVAGGAALGGALGWLYPLFLRRLDGAGAVLLQFLGTFGVWMLADRLGLSAIVTLVCYAITIARTAPSRTPAALRVQSYAVWDVAVFVLNVLAFIFAGLQLRPILAELTGVDWREYAGLGAAVLGAVIAIRLAWVMGYNGIARWTIRRFGSAAPVRVARPTARGGLVIAWCGMRGVVTLATALALPDDFPARGLLLFAAFAVVLGTLVLQGLTLPLLMRVMHLEDDRSVEREVRMARARTAAAALSHIGGHTDPFAGALRAEYEGRGASEPPDGRPDTMLPAHLRAREAALAAERVELVRLRAEGEIGDDAFHAIEEEIDFAVMFVERRLGRM